MGRFKESAWSSLSQAVLRLVVDVHGEGCREDATRLVDDISRLNQQGSISDPRLSKLPQIDFPDFPDFKVHSLAGQN